MVTRISSYTKTEVNYRPAVQNGKRRCQTCVFFRFSERDCMKLNTHVDMNYVCNLWKLRVPELDDKWYI